ncbi:putative nucleolar protein 58 [Apostichopus japonicus]|uniref:Putative nucleolar protein 58 n=1 Tax=Stichopus japonicus TaxID=307972 RepID=A0A2G8JW68_STIJA|nr:putative nucleolar protein 58 [Apostichopus japonicus]
MLVLFESPAGYAVFKLLDEKKLAKVEDLYENFSTPEAASQVVKLKQFEKFEDTTEALAAATALIEGKMGKGLKKVLKKIVAKDAHAELAVADARLGNVIKDKLNLQCVHNSAIQELMRGIRAQFESLAPGIPSKELTAMTLGLAHSLSRYKLKFSPDKVDTMIVQAISLLDDLDKELNNYIMRCREWYGWHFPEMGKIVQDNLAFAKTVKLLGDKTNSATMDFSSILTEDLEEQVKAAAEISMGTEVSTEDIENITYLCDQVIEMTEYRTQLYDYLKNRMQAIGPKPVGACRCQTHCTCRLTDELGQASCFNSTNRGKALFRALKARKDTPKYGLIYHASLVGQSNAKNKGKIARMLAAKCSLAVRYDALGEDGSAESRAISGTGKGRAKFDKYRNKSEVIQYDASMDSTLPSGGKKRKFNDDDEGAAPKKIKTAEEEGPDEATIKAEEESGMAEEETKQEPTTPSSEKKKKKKKKKEKQEEEA